ncbi:MAG TPA: hydrogenase nickel incorporation protein HypB [Pelomicrobium sp.]|nr:hydrogenase nickel incorporation protein HypB [Pelomicrobium sp.]
MCTTCGCGQGETRIEGEHEHEHVHADGTVHSHPHTHDGDHAHEHGHEHAAAHEHVHVHADGTVHSHAHTHAGDHAHAHGVEHELPTGWHRHADGTVHSHDHGHGHGDLHFGLGPARAHAPGMTQARMVKIEQDILAKNDGYARENRRALAERGVFAVNLVSSPGSGKTTLLTKTIAALEGRRAMAVIEGDQQTAFDADRIRATGVPAVQINTGKGCHLDAHMVGRALPQLKLGDGALLFIENVGNLVCPSGFDLGEAHKVVVLSVTEGEDKPLKYPDMFHAATVMLLNKVDLLPYVEFDADRCVEYARRVNPAIEVIRVSATRGDGMDDWLAWLEKGAAAASARRTEIDAVKTRMAELERELAALKSELDGGRRA